MAFTVNDFQDLARLLAQHPEWRSELRRLVLSDELPALVRELVIAQQRTEALLGRLEAAVTALAEAQHRTEERVAELVEAQHRTDRQVAGLVAAQKRTGPEMPDLRGYVLERRYYERGPSYFAPLLRRVQVLRPDQISVLLEAGGDAGFLSEDDADEIRRADVIARGRRRDTAEDAYLVVEVSVTIDPHDIERAAERAALLNRYRPTLAAVGGKVLTAGTEALAEQRGVWRFLDGRTGASAKA